MIIGRISEVSGIRVTATFFDRLPPHLLTKGRVIQSPQINSYVKTRVGLDTVVCQVVGEHEIEFSRKDRSIPAYVEPDGSFLVDLEVRGRIVGTEFLGGLRCLPIVGAKVELMGESDLAALFTLKDSALRVGVNLFDSSVPVSLNANKLIPSHIGIFGNTGSGKSNTLAKIIKEYVRIIPTGSSAAKLLIFDLNNEYGLNAIVNEDQKKVYCLSTRRQSATIPNDEKLPINFSVLTHDNWGTILRATQKTQMPVIRRAFRRWHDGLSAGDCITEIKRILLNKRYQVFFTLREYAGEYFSGIDRISFNQTTNSFYYPPSSKKQYIESLNHIRDIRLIGTPDTLTMFLLSLIFEVSRSSESGTNFDYVQPLLPRAYDAIKDLNKMFYQDDNATMHTLFEDTLLTVIQLGNVNSGMRETIPSLLSELIFQDAVEKHVDIEIKQIVSIVIDEAHNLLGKDSEQNDIIHDNTLRVFEKVIKEGRKFGVYLYLASQRPSDISSTITSQIHNFFIHKLVNPNDIDRIRRTVSFMGDSSLSMLTALGQGECIISGTALIMPQYAYIDELDAGSKPKSKDAVLFGENGIFNNGTNEAAIIAANNEEWDFL